MAWADEIHPHRKECVRKALSFCPDFPGLISVIGSSAGEKYPLGEDIDIALVGMGTDSGMGYVCEVYERVSDSFFRTVKSLLAAKKLEGFDYPLLVQIGYRADDIIVASRQEMIRGHGGACIKFGYLNFPVKESDFPDYMAAYPMRGNTTHRTCIDLIVDYSFRDNGVKENIGHWKTQMMLEGKRYFELPLDL